MNYNPTVLSSKDFSVKYNTIEWLRIFCVCAVVYLHAFGSPLGGKDIISYQNGIYDTIRILFSEGICRAAVPIFFLISGYLFFSRLQEWDKDIWASKLRKRVKSLLIPYFLWNLIAILFSLFGLYIRFYIQGGTSPDILSWFDRIGGLRAFYDSCGGHPFNSPLWFIRDLMIYVIIAPIVYYYIKYTRLVGMILLYIAYFFDFWIDLPGFSAKGLFFFSLGAYFSIKDVDFTYLFKKYWKHTTLIAVPLVVTMVLTWGDKFIWEYVHRLYSLIGAASMIGIVTLLVENKHINAKSYISNSTFFIYAAHKNMVLPLLQLLISKYLPSNTVCLIIGYLIAPLLTIIIIFLIFCLMQKYMPKTTSILSGGRSA